MPTRISLVSISPTSFSAEAVHSEVKRKHVRRPKTRPPSQHKEIILPKSTKNDGGKMLHCDGKILDDLHDADYVKIGESSFRLHELYLIIIQDQVLSLLADLPLDTLQVSQDTRAIYSHLHTVTDLFR